MVNSRIVPACRKLICRLLPTGYLTIEQVSNKLGIPIRTLQRRLDAAGYTYSQLVEAVRLEHACRLLTKSDARMVDIALGIRAILVVPSSGGPASLQNNTGAG